MARLTIAVVVWIGSLAAAAALSNAVAHSIRQSPASSSGSAGSGLRNHGTTSPPVFDPSTVKPADRRSLFHARHFARVLAIARRHLGAGAYLMQLRLTPGEAQLIVRGKGRQRIVAIKANGNYMAFDAGPLASRVTGFQLSQVRAAVPIALERRLTAHAHVPPSRLDYMLVQTDPITHVVRWLVYPIGARRYFESPGATTPIHEYGAGGVRTLRG